MGTSQGERCLVPSKLHFSEDDLKEAGYALGADGEWSRVDDLAAGVSDPEPEPVGQSTLDDLLPAEESVFRGPPPFTLEIHSRRTRLLDPDNTFASAKPLIDALVEIGLLPDDGPEDITLKVTQEKVAHRAEEGTAVKIVKA